jgi:hypothetical protein
MSVTALQEKQTRQQISPPTEKRQRQQIERLTAEEIDRLTEPGQRKRNSELCRELALKAFAERERQERE